TDSLICEAEILLMIRRVFSQLKLSDYTIKINNRKILTGISEVIGEPGREGDLCVAIDKLDKIGWEKVQEELQQKGFAAEAIATLSPIIALENSNAEKIAFLETFLQESATGLQGLKELKEVFEVLAGFGEGDEKVVFDVVLARGLSYYTGAIFEVKINNVSIGSVAGGGRYDNLTGVFGMPDVPGVRFSFGVDRIYDVLEELKLCPESQMDGTQVMIGYRDNAGMAYGLKVLSQVRAKGLSAEIYPEAAKLKKQFNYADKKSVPYVMIIGSQEMEEQKVTLKNMKSGEQEMLPVEEALARLQSR